MNSNIKNKNLDDIDNIQTALENIKLDDKSNILTSLENIKITNTINLEYINSRISKEICHDTIHKLTDKYLINEYKECISVKKEIKKLEIILEKHIIEINKKKLIIDDYILDLIPAGTKGVIRGNKFNGIIKNTINNLNLNNEKFEICFEKKCKIYITSEIPDWYILEKLTNKVIIGMNQLDLWGGGQQLNRGFKYLNNKNNTDKSKLLCVVCNDIKINSNKNKIYKLFEIGYLNDTLCHIKNLKLIIYNFFNLN